MMNLIWTPPPTNMEHSLYLNILRLMCERYICKLFTHVKVIKLKLLEGATQGIKQRKLVFQW